MTALAIGPTGRGRRVARAVGILLGAAACAPDAPTPEPASRTPFALDTEAVGVVADNAADCVVDGICSVRLSFADTTVVVVYGTGERPSPPCRTPPAASDAAFGVDSGQAVRVVVRACDGGELHLEALSVLPPARGGGP